MPLKQPYSHVNTHRLHFGPRVAHWPEATHTSASPVLPSPLPTRMSLHHLTPSHPSPFIPLLLDVQRLSSVLSRVRHGASGRPCALFPHSNANVYLSHPNLACRRRPLDTGVRPNTWSSVCRTMVHSARTPTTRPLPRPAAITSRHATSRAMQVTSALLVSQAAPAALSSPHSSCLSLSCSCKPTCKGCNTMLEPRVDDASL
jgi:hypothetical protein